MNAAEKALATFRTPPHNHTCPQAICAAFGHDEMLEDVRTMGAGRAPGGLCGSLYAACLLAPGHAEEIKAEFQAANGAIRCAELRQLRVPCQACVRTSAMLLEKALG